MDAFDDLAGFTAYSLYHEQSASFAASAYAQRVNKIGVAYATSGPGATNLVTGIAHAFYESVPVLFITGQVNTKEAKGNLKIRQKGFQETDVVSIVNSITKYSSYVPSAKDIRYELEKAFYEAKAGRPGPVLLDIPIDVQRTEINPKELKSFLEPDNAYFDYQSIMNTLKLELDKAEKPVLLLGNGINV
jgi:acetolactate synthase I/II/III large subunit